MVRQRVILMRKKQPKTTENNRSADTVVLGGIIGGATTTTLKVNKTIEDDVVVDDLHARLCAETVWVESVCMNLGKSTDYIHNRISEYCTEQKVQGVVNKSLADAKRHFRFWLRKVEEIEADRSRRGEPTPTSQPYIVYTYAEMLSEVGKKGGTTNDYATLYVGNATKPMWVRLVDKTKFNIPDKVERLCGT